MSKTLVYVAHPDVAGSASHQFLIQSGRALTDATYVDLQAELEANGGRFDSEAELRRLCQFDRVIFQFQLYWYQAPAILKQWFDQVFNMSSAMMAAKPQLAQMEMGIIVIAGVKASHYQIGGREGVTLSTLLAPYYAWARHFGLQPLPPFAVHQFQHLSESDKQTLLVTSAAYLETGTVENFDQLQTFVSQHLTQMDLQLSGPDQLVFENFRQTIVDNQLEIHELQALNQEGN